ncbi:unnamed protein product, partial [Amoebophrya sp. A25]
LVDSDEFVVPQTAFFGKLDATLDYFLRAGGLEGKLRSLRDRFENEEKMTKKLLQQEKLLAKLLGEEMAFEQILPPVFEFGDSQHVETLSDFDFLPRLYYQSSWFPRTYKSILWAPIIKQNDTCCCTRTTIRTRTTPPPSSSGTSSSTSSSSTDQKLQQSSSTSRNSHKNMNICSCGSRSSCTSTSTSSNINIKQISGSVPGRPPFISGNPHTMVNEGEDVPNGQMIRSCEYPLKLGPLLICFRHAELKSVAWVGSSGL